MIGSAKSLFRKIVAFPRSSGIGTLSWQARRSNSDLKAALIEPMLREFECRSVLDIGCNAGEVSRKVSKDRFVVGLDGALDTRGFERPFEGVALGQVRVSMKVLETTPVFDAVMLLSVHHQWYASMSAIEADNLFSAVLNRAAKIVFIEFAAINDKYGGNQGFIDNHADSVISYASEFLSRFVPKEKISYLGKCSELMSKEPYRYMFMINRR